MRIGSLVSQIAMSDRGKKKNDHTVKSNFCHESNSNDMFFGKFTKKIGIFSIEAPVQGSSLYSFFFFPCLKKS